MTKSEAITLEDITKVPVINNRQDLKERLNNLYIINDYLKDYETYGMFYEKMYNLIKGCFVIASCREYPIKFKFYKTDKATHTLQLRHFITNLILWYPFVELSDLDGVLDETFILDCEKDIPKLQNYMNDVIISTLRDYHIKTTTINYAISEVLHNLRKISQDFSIIMGLNFGIKDFLDLYNGNQEFHDIMECSFDRNQQPHEIEAQLADYQNTVIDIFKKDPRNPIGVLLRVGTGIKHKQLIEFCVSEGLKPTVDGKTIPLPINNSTLLRGTDRPSYHFLDATGARKSLGSLLAM